MPHDTPRFNLIAAVNAYESGDMTAAEAIDFFQHLIDTGLAWQLQGSYGRTARTLIANGDCHV